MEPRQTTSSHSYTVSRLGLSARVFRNALLTSCVIAAAACGGPSLPGLGDAARGDTGATEDTAPSTGDASDASQHTDSGATDAGATDAGATDAGAVDVATATDAGPAVDAAPAVDVAVPTDTGPAADAGPTPFGPRYTGMASWYDTNVAEGNCSYASLPADRHVAALGTAQYMGSEACGECFEVTGPRGSVVVTIVDRCPGCSANTINLSEQAFAAVGNVSAGRIGVNWQAVPCPVTHGITLGFDHNSTQYWIGIQVRDERIPVRSVEIQHGSSWTPLVRQTDNYFTARNMGAGPFNIHVTAIDGQEFVEMGVAMHAGASVTTTHQFE